MRALTIQGTSAGEPRLEAVAALHIGAQIGLTPGAGEQGNVTADAEARLIKLTNRVFEAGTFRRYVNVAVVARRTRFQRIQCGMTARGRQQIGQRDAQIRSAPEHHGVQGQADLTRFFMHWLQLLRILRKQVGRAIEPERRFAAALQAQAPV